MSKEDENEATALHLIKEFCTQKHYYKTLHALEEETEQEKTSNPTQSPSLLELIDAYHNPSEEKAIQQFQYFFTSYQNLKRFYDTHSSTESKEPTSNILHTLQTPKRKKLEKRLSHVHLDQPSTRPLPLDKATESSPKRRKLEQRLTDPKHPSESSPDHLASSILETMKSPKRKRLEQRFISSNAAPALPEKQEADSFLENLDIDKALECIQYD